MKDDDSPIVLCHSRESGNPEAARASLSDVFLAEAADWIPAFAGMTKYYSTVIAFHNASTSALQPSWRAPLDFFTRSFAGMTRQGAGLLDPFTGYLTAMPSRVRAARFLRTLFRGNGEE